MSTAPDGEAAANNRGPRVELAHEPDFRLGALQVGPSACQVRHGDHEIRLEPRVMEVLVYLARRANRTVTRDELIAACWGGRFVSDDAVSRVIGKVRELGRSVEPSPFVLDTVPRVGFRLRTADAEAPPAQIPPAAATVRAPPPWRAILIALAILALIGAAWTAWRLVGPDARPAGQNGRVEVMLFEPLQAEPELQRFSVTLGDAVVRVLSRVGVETAQHPLARDAAAGSGTAEFRIAGTVDRDGETYVVDAQVIDRASGGVLWSGRLDRPAGSPVGFHEEAANRIGDIVHCAVTHRRASNHPVDAHVFGLLLYTCELRRAKEGQDFSRLYETTTRLVQAAPNVSVAHSLHAMAAALMANNVTQQASEVAALHAQAKASAARALKLDPDNGEAYFALALNHGDVGKWLERERDFLKAAELSPDLSVVRNYYANLLREVGRLKEARAVNERTVASDPFSPAQLSHLAAQASAAGDADTAQSLLDRIELMDPVVARARRLQIEFWQGDPETARRNIPALVRPGTTAAHRACFDRHLARIAREPRPILGLPPECDTVQPDMRVRMLARQGDVDAALAEFARTPLAGPGMGSSFLFFPEMAAFWRDPRAMTMARRTGLVDYWTKSGHWPDFCADPGLPYDCRKVAAAAR